MPTGPKITLKDYYQNFGAIRAALVAATCLEPLASTLLPSDAAAHLFPPLGDQELLARLCVLSLAVAMTFVAYFFPLKKIGAALVSLLGVAALAFVSLFLLYSAFVVEFDHSGLWLSIGYRCNDVVPGGACPANAQQAWNALKSRGGTDIEVHEFWTAQSILSVRLLLLTAFCGFVLPIVLAFSLGVRHDMESNRVHTTQLSKGEKDVNDEDRDGEDQSKRDDQSDEDDDDPFDSEPAAGGEP